jgi:hypothetical protein
MNAKTVEEEALELPVEERARLAERLLESLDGLPERDVENLWLEVAERRAQGIDEGSVELVTPEELANGSRHVGVLRERRTVPKLSLRAPERTASANVRGESAIASWWPVQPATPRRCGASDSGATPLVGEIVRTAPPAERRTTACCTVAPPPLRD